MDDRKTVGFACFRCQFINQTVLAARKLLSPNLPREACSLDDNIMMTDSDKRSIEDDFKDLMRQFFSGFFFYYYFLKTLCWPNLFHQVWDLSKIYLLHIVFYSSRLNFPRGFCPTPAGT